MIITLLRKPLEGSVAENTLKHGCGAINIDETRVSSHDKTKNHSRKSEASKTKGIYGDSSEQEIGRFPANFILTHKDGCELKGTKKIKSGTAHQDNKTKSNYVYGGGGSFSPVNMKGKAGYADEDGKETVADWACVEDCPVKELDQQSGRVKGWSSQNHNTFNPYQGNSFHSSSTQRQGYKEGYNDEGGASRFFKQFKKENNQ